MSTVIAKLIGGLGNQMFQYATGRALADRYGAKLKLDISGFAHYGLRRYELGSFDIRAEIATAEELARFGMAPRVPTLLNRMVDCLGLLRSGEVLREAAFTYDERLEMASVPVYLDGYWQSERYFAPIAEALRSDFSLREALDSGNAELAAQIDAEAAAVSLHVRRGDYVNDPHTAKYHGVCSLAYYRAAVDHIAAHVQRPHFFVFSDDHEWVMTNLDIPHATTLVRINGADRGMYDLSLMRRCRHHVVANSSFSWWGAWLNPASDKIVVAPERWFAGASHDTRDLIPSTWTRL